jgi:REP-associated tyrosine transposase
MPRKPRICLEDTTYHTMSRCIETNPLMRPKRMKDLMISVLNLALQTYQFDLVNYIIMDNHFHFYIKTRTKGESISRIMQFIKSQYARRYNRIMHRTGPFWNERFKDTIIEFTREPVLYFFYILMYIAFNPVRSHVATDPRNYPYSGINCYLDQHYVSPVPITLHAYFLKLGNTFKERAQKLLEYEDMYRKRIICDCLFE